MRQSAGGGTARSPNYEPDIEKANPTLASASETAEYIADLLWQLERLANAHGLVRLQYLLIQSREEARDIAGMGSAASQPAKATSGHP